MGEIHIAEKSLLSRHWNEASVRTHQEVTVVTIMTNLAGIKVALELEKQRFCNSDSRFRIFSTTHHPRRIRGLSKC